jgi:hypothetical protein
MSCFHIFLLALVAVACSDFVLGYSMPSLNRARAAGAGFRLHGKITPNKGESMDQYRKVGTSFFKHHGECEMHTSLSFVSFCLLLRLFWTR